MAGYSKRSLKDKLGIKDGNKVLILNEPSTYRNEIGNLNRNDVHTKINGQFDFIHFFTSSKEEFIREYSRLKDALSKSGMLWISWPKKSSKIATDLNENIIRDYALENGLVDVKVCAVDDTWSGLKLVYRLKDR